MHTVTNAFSAPFFFNTSKLLEPSFLFKGCGVSQEGVYLWPIHHTHVPTKYSPHLCKLTQLTGRDSCCSGIARSRFSVYLYPPPAPPTKSLLNWRFFLCFITSKWSDSFQPQFSNFPPSFDSPFFLRGPIVGRENKPEQSYNSMLLLRLSVITVLLGMTITCWLLWKTVDLLMFIISLFKL